MKIFFQTNKPQLLLALNAFFLFLLYFLTTIYMTFSSLAYSSFLWGLYFRKNKKIHIFLMSTGIAMDILMVLLLEFQREALDTALSFSLGIFPIIHIVFSSLAVALYIPVLCLGLGLYFQWISSKRLRLWHIYLGLSAFFFRSIGYILMFSLLGATPYIA